MSEEGGLEGFGGRRCPHCMKFVIPEEQGNALICPNCHEVIEKRLQSGRTVQIERPEDFGDGTVAASELTIDLSLESLPVQEVRARAPFFIENWQIRMSQFQDGGFYAVMECQDVKGNRFRWNTSGKQVLTVLEEAERRGIKRIYVREVLFDEVGGRPRNIRIR